MIRKWIAALLTVAALAGPVTAAPFAEQSYMSGFVDHWKSTIGKQNTIIVGVLFVGALGIFIITRGKKLK